MPIETLGLVIVPIVIGWAGARVGIGMLWGGGIPLIEKKNQFQMFKLL